MFDDFVNILEDGHFEEEPVDVKTFVEGIEYLNQPPLSPAASLSLGSSSSFRMSGFLETLSLMILDWKLFMRTVTSLAPVLLSVFSWLIIS